MVSQTQNLPFSLCLLLFISQASAKPEYENRYAVCYTTGEYAPNSTYDTNLKVVLSRLTTSNTKIDYGFYSYAYGQEGSDRVYATGICRGDVTPHACRTCLNNSASLLLKQCPNKNQAQGGYDICKLHYAYYSLDGYQEYNFWVYNSTEANVTDWHQYSYVLNNLLATLRVKAATTDPSLNRKYASGNATAPNSQTIYAVVQCNPDLTAGECNDCLNRTFSKIPECCNNRSGGRVIRSTCDFRYENYSFYKPMPDTLTLQLSPQGPPSPSPSIEPSTTAKSSQGTHHGILTLIIYQTCKLVHLYIFIIRFIYLFSLKIW
ncbi:hypothetical protein Fmac_023386 [Flemingia macrophylla]|uniref:Gnk2-homologous domain-containing protein n=1 Tax=Flemingia macrophylla TaxID=520843 RepID=A0ABD1LLC3_9FABA